MGRGVTVAKAQNLVFNGTCLTWETQTACFFNAEGKAATFAEGDNVCFTSKSTVLLGSDITVGTMSLEKGAEITIDLSKFTLNFDRIELSGVLDMGDALHIGEGDTLFVNKDGAVLESALILGSNCRIEFAGSASLDNNTLGLHKGAVLSLSTTGDGCTYDLFSDVSGLVDAFGSPLSLNATNNSMANYFDVTHPGSGFWSNSTLQISGDTLQIVRYTDISLPADYGATVTVDSVDDISSYSTLDTDVIFEIGGIDLSGASLVVDGLATMLMTPSSGSWFITSTFVQQCYDTLIYCCFREKSRVQLFKICCV